MNRLQQLHSRRAVACPTESRDRLWSKDPPQRRRIGRNQVGERDLTLARPLRQQPLTSRTHENASPPAMPRIGRPACGEKDRPARPPAALDTRHLSEAMEDRAGTKSAGDGGAMSRNHLPPYWCRPRAGPRDLGPATTGGDKDNSDEEDDPQHRGDAIPVHGRAPGSFWNTGPADRSHARRSGRFRESRFAPAASSGQ